MAAKDTKEYLFAWEGKDKSGKVIKGEMRADERGLANGVMFGGAALGTGRGDHRRRAGGGRRPRKRVPATSEPVSSASR